MISRKVYYAISVLAFLLGCGYCLLCFWAGGEDFHRSPGLAIVFISTPLVGTIFTCIAQIPMIGKVKESK